MPKAKKFSWNDIDARKALERYESVVRMTARKLRPAASLGNALDEEDLCAEGRVAVLEALNTYGGFGIKERTWVRTRVRQRMIDAIRRLDVRTRDEIRLATKHAAGDDIEGEDAERARGIRARRLVSIDVSPGSDGEPLIQRLKDSMAPTAEQCTQMARQHERLTMALASIPPRQRRAIELGMYDGLALREIGERMGISESRVCQLQKRAVEHLRKFVADSNRDAA